jgi:hypothetical protein
MPTGGTLWRYHLCLQPISLEQQLGSSRWLAATAADGERQLMKQWTVLIVLMDLCGTVPRQAPGDPLVGDP